MTAETPLTTAIFLHALGYRVHPLRQKAPFTDAWNTREWTEESLRREFADADGVGWHLYGYLDFDCDGETADERAAAYDAYESLRLPATVSWQSTRGPHFVYALSPEQLAAIQEATNRQKFKIPGTTLEVRFGLRPGTYLQSAIPPSGGRTWRRSLLEHEPAAIETLDWLFDALPQRSLPPAPTNGERGNRPGDIFNRDATWEEILEPLGYVAVGNRSVDGRLVTDWLRPGSDKQLNATTGFCQSTLEDDKLYVFSSSWEPFEQDESYSKFEAYALTRHNGDYGAAAKDVADQGYEATCDPRVFDDIDVPASEERTGSPARMKASNCATPRAVKEDPDILTDLLSFPGFVERVVAWHLQRAHIVDRRAGAVAGLMTASWMLGRRVRLFDGTRPNIAIMLTGTPGGGKTEIEHTIASLISGAGYHDVRCQDVASGQGLEDALMQNNNLIFIRDEIQHLFEGDYAKNPHVQATVDRVKRIFSMSRSLYIPRKKANEKIAPPPIVEPNLAVLFMGVPSVWSYMPRDVYNDGFMARLLSVDTVDKPMINDQIHLGAPPDDLLAEIRQWRGAAVFEDDGKDGEQRPNVAEIPCSPTARDFLLSLKHEWINKGEDVEMFLYRRGQELACKLSLIAGATGGGEIDLPIAERAAKIVEASIANKLQHGDQRGYGDRDFLDVVSRARRYIREHRTVRFWEGASRMNITNEVWRRVVLELYSSGEIDLDGQPSADHSRFTKIPTKVWVKD